MDNSLDFKVPSSKITSWMEQVKKMTGGKYKGNTLYFDNTTAKGNITSEKVQKGLDYVKINIKPYFNFNYVRDSDESEQHFSVVISIDQVPFTLICEGKEVKFDIDSQSKIFLLSPRGKLRLKMQKNSNYIFIIIFIDNYWVNQNILDDKNESDISKLMDLSRPAIFYQNIQSDYQEIINELFRVNGKGKIFKLSAFIQLISTLFTDFRIKELNQTLKVKEKDVVTIFEICKVIDSDISNMEPLEVLAKRASMSISKFKYTFKYITGLSPYQYHLQYKLEKAKKMLINSNMTVSEVGYLCGYTNLSHFSRVFKKLHGVLPNNFKK